jgi:general secretion pathway protein F
MSAYQYLALKENGRTCKGIIEADSERQARQLLREKGLIPTQITGLKKTPKKKKKRHFPAQDLCLMTRQLATLLAAGIPLEEALKGVGEQSTKESVRVLVFGVRAKVLEGYGLAQAMGEEPQAFPELYRATIAAGEQTGKLDMVLEKLADYTEYQQQTRQKIQQAMIYPLVMVIVSISIISFLLAFVVPKIIEVFNSSGQVLPPMTKILITLSAFIQNNGLYLFLFALLGLWGARRSLKKPHILHKWHQILLQCPGLSFFIKTVNIARYTHTFSILFAAGVSVLETMRVSSSLITNVIMREHFDLATVHVKEGTSISQALNQTSFMNPMAIHLIASGEKSGQLAPMMERTALHLDNEVRRLIDTMMTLLEPTIIIFMGAVILFIVLATLLPIFSMEQLVT